MSRRQSAKKSTPELPLSTQVAEDHRCVVCKRWGCFGIIRRGADGAFNVRDPSDWYCSDHKPMQYFPHMKRTWAARFEDAYLEIKRATNANS